MDTLGRIRSIGGWPGGWAYKDRAEQGSMCGGLHIVGQDHGPEQTILTV